MAVDFTKPIQTIDGDVAMLLRTLANQDYKYLVLVTDDGVESTHMVDDDGDTNDATGFIENVDPADAIRDPEEAPERPEVTVLELPRNLQPIVRHRRRGRGRIVKLRAAPYGKDGKTVLVRFDDGKDLWAFDKYVSLI